MDRLVVTLWAVGPLFDTVYRPTYAVVYSVAFNFSTSFPFLLPRFLFPSSFFFLDLEGDENICPFAVLSLHRVLSTLRREIQKVSSVLLNYNSHNSPCHSSFSFSVFPVNLPATDVSPFCLR